MSCVLPALPYPILNSPISQIFSVFFPDMALSFLAHAPAAMPWASLFFNRTGVRMFSLPWRTER